VTSDMTKRNTDIENGLRPRHRAESCEVRARTKHKMIEAMASVDAFFDNLERGPTEHLERAELATMMTEINNGVAVGDAAIARVHAQASTDSSGLPLPHAHPTRTGKGEPLRRAIADWRYSSYKDTFVAPYIDNAPRDHPTFFNVDELEQLVVSLNDGVSPTEIEMRWVVGLVGKAANIPSGNTAALALAMPLHAVHTAVAAWYPAEGGGKQRRRAPMVDRAVAGITRRSIASQLEMHRHVTNSALFTWLRRNSKLPPDRLSTTAMGWQDKTETITRDELHRFMQHDLNDGQSVSAQELDYVMLLSDIYDPLQIWPLQIKDALAHWRTLRQQQHEIDAHFERYDRDGTGVLERNEVKCLLNDLNEGIPVSDQEVEWAIHSADMDNSGTLSRAELRAAISSWYLHVAKPRIRITTGACMLLPWLFASLIGCTCALLVALASVRFSPEVTQAWLSTTLLGLMWKMIVFDPIKALCCATLIGERAFPEDTPS
jgi:Ca2+-binding EF-hand superfamily protein